eukprot:jgi/Chlat1/4535/Chrsp29S08895
MAAAVGATPASSLVTCSIAWSSRVVRKAGGGVGCEAWGRSSLALRLGRRGAGKGAVVGMAAVTAAAVHDIINQPDNNNYSHHSGVSANGFSNLEPPQMEAERRFEARQVGSNDKSAALAMVAILGDLHLEPAQMHLFHAARQQLNKAIDNTNAGASSVAKRVVQLGDLGGYSHRPGSRECFAEAKKFLDSFESPYLLVTGNHDLEGDEFATDAENLAAWRSAFRHCMPQSARVGPALLVGMSTVRFRDNRFSVHEVFVDDEQVEWFRTVLAHNKGVPIIVFTHAPPLGCGLRVLHQVHVRNRCAFLNHTDDDADAFIKLVQENPQISLWFSGHYHLSHNYADSISVTEGRCAFVQTGVIGQCTKDGQRHSRVLKIIETGYEVYTLDHDDDAPRLRLDLHHEFGSPDPPSPIVPVDELLCDPSKGYLCGRTECSIIGENIEGVMWFPAGPSCMLALQDELLVEYNTRWRAPIGVVAKGVEHARVRLLDSAGEEVTVGDGSEAVVAEITREDGSVERVERNDRGGFFKVFQPNKWRLKLQQKEALAFA